MEGDGIRESVGWESFLLMRGTLQGEDVEVNGEIGGGGGAGAGLAAW